MGIPRKDPLNTARFHCRACGHRFEAEPDRVSRAPELEHHPYEYFAKCPDCEEEAGQDHREKALLKAWAKSTGPKTAEGRERSLKNLEGHPTPEEAKLNRFNGLKHGLYAKAATYWPARPGKYPDCENGEHLASGDCYHPPRACFKRTELLLKHRIAFETKDPGLLTELRADTQAGVQSLIDWMILAITRAGGPEIKDVVWYHDKDGILRLAKWIDQDGEQHQIYELKAHPLLKPLMEFISRNNLALSDQGMTPRVQDDQEAMQGFLDRSERDQSEDDEYKRRIEEGQQKLLALIGAGRDPRETVTVDGEVVNADPE